MTRAGCCIHFTGVQNKTCKEGGAHKWLRGQDAKNERVYICEKCRCWIVGEPPARP